MLETKAVGLISGGLDSTVVAAYMQENYDTNYYLFCNYGQKTLERERQAFNQICDRLQPYGKVEVDMTWMRQVGKSALFETDIKLDADNRKLEYVPFRNACLLAAAVALAETVEADAILIGSTGGDRTCPDNSLAFANAFQHVITEGTMSTKPIELVTPLINSTKEEVIAMGTELGAPFELSWSCHNNLGNLACGVCSNCSSRRGAFTNLGLTDPTNYE